ncbi:MAG: ATP-binding protein [bacterium JZ-2024 1]
MKRKPVILIIDDEEVVRDSCAEALSSGEYEVYTAPDGTSGLKIVREKHPDLVFIDLKMPGISGFEVIDQVQKFDPTVVSIVITGYATVSSAVDSIKKGAYDFLPKPFAPDELRLIASRGLERRRLLLETAALRAEKEWLREHFATIVAHELKSPLAAVMQNIMVLLGGYSGELTEQQKQIVERMKVRIETLLKLIHTWLKLTSISADALQNSFQPTNVVAVASKAVESLEGEAAQKTIRIETELPSGPVFVSGDEGTLLEAITNILSNAVKYSRPEGTVVLRICPDKEWVRISVTDTGIGIRAEDIPRIFEGFYRAGPETIRSEGTGLGLAIAKRIVEAHLGTISVESVLDEGSTFTISLPVLSAGETGQIGNLSPQTPEVSYEKGSQAVAH